MQRALAAAKARINFEVPISVAAQSHLLMGFAFENLLKGIAAADRTKPAVTPKGKLAPHIIGKNHNLRQLAEDHGVPLREEWKPLLKLLTTYIRGPGGRYPLPGSVGEDRVTSLSTQHDDVKLFEEVFEEFGVELLERFGDRFRVNGEVVEHREFIRLRMAKALALLPRTFAANLDGGPRCDPRAA